MNYYNGNISDSDDEEDIVYQEDENIEKMMVMCFIHFSLKYFNNPTYIYNITNNYITSVLFLIPILFIVSKYLYMDFIDFKKTIIIMYISLSVFSLNNVIYNQCSI